MLQNPIRSRNEAGSRTPVQRIALFGHIVIGLLSATNESGGGSGFSFFSDKYITFTHQFPFNNVRRELKNMKHEKCRCIRGVFVVVPSLAAFGAIKPAAAQSARHGFYAGGEVGFAQARDLNSRVSGVSHPTRCDGLIPGHTPPADDPECADNTPGTLARNSFDLGTGFVGALNAGYMMGGWRFEVEYLHRRHDGDFSLWRGSGGNAALASKVDEWTTSERPSERVSDFRAHQFFVNAYYDFLGDSAWTPCIGTDPVALPPPFQTQDHSGRIPGAAGGSRYDQFPGYRNQ